jgi:hypothetical protein
MKACVSAIMQTRGPPGLADDSAGHRHEPCMPLESTETCPINNIQYYYITHLFSVLMQASMPKYDAGRLHRGGG